jgi:ethylbenzene dioxygenase alpha subunit
MSPGDPYRQPSQQRAAGMCEQNDVDNWRQVTAASTSRFGRRHPQDLSMGVGHAGLHPDYPGLVSERYISENNQRLFYMRWEEFMNAGSWADIGNRGDPSIDPAAKSSI